MPRILVLIISCVLVVGILCCDESPTSRDNQDAASAHDSNLLDVATVEDALEADDTPESPVDDVRPDVEEDTGGDTSPSQDPYWGRPLGQCTEHADCPEGPQGRTCSRALPGGTCLGCSPDSGCPDGTICSNFGSCVASCQSNDECPPGLHCLGGNRRCGAIPCVDGLCPVPLFGCSASDLCTRKSCDSQAQCPQETTCITGLCIEDRALAR